MKRIGLLIIFTTFSLSYTFVYAGTGFLQGERISGLNKICFYNGAAGSFTKTMSSTSICPQSVTDGRGYNNNAMDSYDSNPTYGGQSREMGFLKGENSSSLIKTCFYEGYSGIFTKTVGTAEICPQTAYK